jgi:hypothetical protein
LHQALTTVFYLDFKICRALQFLEHALLCPHRAYYVTVKVKNSTGLPGSKSLKGDIICFTQDGPAEALKLLGSQGDTMRQRIEWVRGGGSFRVILVDDKGNIEKLAPR